MERFVGRRVLVTGAASGIGQATALRLLAEGAEMVAADVAETGLKETAGLAASAAERLTTTVLDISDEEAVAAAVGAAVDRLGGLDVLVNAAGILRGAHTHECSLAMWQEVLSVNLTGTFLMTRAALPALLKSRGVVVNFGSTSASFGHPYMAAYAASKGAIESFTHTLAVEYAGRGLRAVVVKPGGILTGITKRTMELLPSDVEPAMFRKLVPALGNGLGEPEAVASVVAMLASDDGRFITGTEVRVDGGAHA